MSGLVGKSHVNLKAKFVVVTDTHTHQEMLYSSKIYRKAIRTEVIQLFALLKQNILLTFSYLNFRCKLIILVRKNGQMLCVEQSV